LPLPLDSVPEAHARPAPDTESGDRCCVEVVEGAQKRATEKASSVSTGLCYVAAKHRSDLNKEQQRMSVLFLLSFFVEIFSFSSMIRPCLWRKKNEVLKKRRCHNLLLGYEGSFFPKP
jgi:hypothetical protein